MQPTKYIWKDGELIGWDDATVHVLSHALHYGTGAFEGIRAYATDRGPAAFRLTEHMERLTRSCKVLGIPFEWSAGDLAKAAKELIAVNELPAGYVRPVVFYGTGSIGLNPSPFDSPTLNPCLSRLLLISLGEYILGYFKQSSHRSGSL